MAICLRSFENATKDNIRPVTSRKRQQSITTGSNPAISAIAPFGIECNSSSEITAHGLISSGLDNHNQPARPNTTTTQREPTSGQVHTSFHRLATNAFPLSVSFGRTSFICLLTHGTQTSSVWPERPGGAAVAGNDPRLGELDARMKGASHVTQLPAIEEGR